MSVVRDRGAFLGVGVVTVRDEALGRLYDRAIAGLRTREDHRNDVCTASIAIRFAVYALEGVQALSEHAPYTFSATVAGLRALAAFGGVVWTPEHPVEAREGSRGGASKRGAGERIPGSPTPRALNRTAAMASEASMTELDPVAKFLSAWRVLPPLVRASVASRMYTKTAADVHYLLPEVELDRRVGCDRRARVTEAHIEGLNAITSFFAALTKEADDEAKERGIDADVASGPRDLLEEAAHREGVPIEQLRAEFAAWHAARKS